MQRTPRSTSARKKPTPRNKKVANAAIAGLSALLLAGLGTAVFQGQRAEARNAEIVASYTPSSTYSAPPAADVALFIGDSYTVGVGVGSKANRWTTIVSREMRWMEANYGQGGTGYVTTSGRNGCGRAECPTYPDRLAESKGQVSPDVVFISGGQNDFLAYRGAADNVDQAIRDTFTQAAEMYPDASLVAVGPSSTDGVNAVVVKMDEVVQEAAEQVDATYVSLINPEVIKPNMVADDGVHVGDEGHAAIAERVLDTLR